MVELARKENNKTDLEGSTATEIDEKRPTFYPIKKSSSSSSSGSSSSSDSSSSADKTTDNKTTDQDQTTTTETNAGRTTSPLI